MRSAPLTPSPPPTSHTTPCRDPEPEALDALTLEGVRGVLESQLHPANLELNVAGDFDEAELEEVVLHYLGE